MTTNFPRLVSPADDARLEQFRDRVNEDTRSDVPSSPFTQSNIHAAAAAVADLHQAYVDTSKSGLSKVFAVAKVFFSNIILICWHYYIRGGNVKKYTELLLKVERLNLSPIGSGYLVTLRELAARVARDYNGESTVQALVDAQKFLGIFYRVVSLGAHPRVLRNTREAFERELAARVLNLSYQDRLDRLCTKEFHEKVGMRLAVVLHANASPQRAEVLTQFPRGVEAVLRDSLSKDTRIRIAGRSRNTVELTDVRRKAIKVDSLQLALANFSIEMNRDIREKMGKDFYDFVVQRGEEYAFSVSIDQNSIIETVCRRHPTSLKGKKKGLKQRAGKDEYGLETHVDGFHRKVEEMDRAYCRLKDEYLEYLKGKHGGDLQPPEDMSSASDFHEFAIDLVKRRDHFIHHIPLGFDLFGRPKYLYHGLAGRILKESEQKVSGFIAEFQTARNYFHKQDDGKAERRVATVKPQNPDSEAARRRVDRQGAERRRALQKRVARLRRQ